MCRIFVVILCSLALSACGSKQIECNDEAALSTLKSLMEESIEEEVKKELSGNKDLEWNASKARAILAKVTITFTDVRTTKKDPSSTKRFCEANINATIPADIADVANKVRVALGYKEISGYANTLDLKFEAGKSIDSIEYAAQPTDDGKKVYVESEKKNKTVVFVTEVIAANLIKPMLDAAETERARAREEEEARQVQQARLQQEQEAEMAKQQLELKSQQESLRLERAQLSLKEANDQINVVWNAATPEFRKMMLPEQKTWLKQRDLDCKLKATTVPAENGASEREIVRLNCEIEMTASRTNYLKEKILRP